jgi:signal transduction histidine kinase/CheY-like chemotaxis protein
VTQPWREAGGAVGGLIMFTEVTTDRKRADAELRDSERRCRALLEGSPVCNKIIDLDSRLIYMSAAGVKQLKIPDIEPYYGQIYPPEFFPEAVRARLIEYLERAKAGETCSVECPVHDMEGCEIWYHTTFVPARDDEGRVEYVIAASVDITERKRAEEEKVGLERQVNHAQKLESLGVLAGGIAHDFNNLMLAILGNADLALQGLSPMAPARRNIEEIEKAFKRASELANQMLAYSGKGSFVLEPINAGELLEEMAHLLKAVISKKAVFEFDLAEDLPTFYGDATQIRQVVMNLLTNASESIGDLNGVIRLATGVMECDRAYLDTTSQILRAGLEEELPGGQYVFFEVSDTGCGMDAATLEKVFDPFFTTKFTGRGLGMSAVLGIVRGHNGAIKISSEVGKGTTFRALFPAQEMSDNAVVVLKSEEALDGWRGVGTALVADDEEAVRDVAKRILETIGFSVVTAADGREALDVFVEHADEIVCVLLDQTMPHVDGAGTFAALRRLRPGIKVVMCSGYNEQTTMPEHGGKGLDGFIHKPYTIEDMKSKLMEVLGEATPPSGTAYELPRKPTLLRTRRVSASGP